MRKVEGMLRAALGRPEIVKAARAWRTMHRWPEIVGEGLAERSAPDRYDRGTVWVAVKGSAWAQELRLMKETILERMNAMAGDRLFTEIRFGVRKAKAPPTLPPALSTERPVPTSEGVAAALERAERDEETGDWRDGLSILEIAARRLAAREGAAETPPAPGSASPLARTGRMRASADVLRGLREIADAPNEDGRPVEPPPPEPAPDEDGPEDPPDHSLDDASRILPEDAA